MNHTTDRHIFFEIALQSDAGGTTRAVIRQGVDVRQKLLLSDEELDGGLRRLVDAGLIEMTNGQVRVTSQLLHTLPLPHSAWLSAGSRQGCIVQRPAAE